MNRAKVASSSSVVKTTILVVDDEKSYRKLIGAILERDGYQVLEADGGIDALERWKRHVGKIDLVITDVTMPDMSGHDLVQALLKMQAGLRVLYMSGNPWEMVKTAVPHISAISFIAKPTSTAAILARVQLALGERE